MTTITLNLPDDQVERLTEEAGLAGLTLQELALYRVRNSWQSAEEPDIKPEFEEVTDYVFQKNEKLYRRLA